MEEINFLEILGMVFWFFVALALLIGATDGHDGQVNRRSFCGVLLIILTAATFAYIGYQIGKDLAQEDKTLIENKQSIKDVNNE